MATLLVTGFGAFPGHATNPSATLVMLLARRYRQYFVRLGLKLTTHVLPVAYAEPSALDAMIRQIKPDAVLHIGVAGGRRYVSIETRAKNRLTILKPDASGAFYRRLSIEPYGPFARKSTWNYHHLRTALVRGGIKAALSNDAGDYLCNALLWRSLQTQSAPTIFLHVPKKGHIAPAKLARALAQILPHFIASAANRAKPDRTE